MGKTRQERILRGFKFLGKIKGCEIFRIVQLLELYGHYNIGINIGFPT